MAEAPAVASLAAPVAAVAIPLPALHPPAPAQPSAPLYASTLNQSVYASLHSSHHLPPRLPRAAPALSYLTYSVPLPPFPEGYSAPLPPMPRPFAQSSIIPALVKWIAENFGIHPEFSVQRIQEPEQLQPPRPLPPSSLV